MIQDGTDVIIIEIKCTINVMCLKHLETLPPPRLLGKIVFHKTGPWCWKGWGPLPSGTFICKALFVPSYFSAFLVEGVGHADSLGACFGLKCDFQKVPTHWFFFLRGFVLKTLGWSEKRACRKGPSRKRLTLPPARVSPLSVRVPFPLLGGGR